MTGILCFSLLNETDLLSSIFCVASVLFIVEFHLMLIFIRFTIYNLPLPLPHPWPKNVNAQNAHRMLWNLLENVFFLLNKSLITSFMCGLISNLCGLSVEKSKSTHLFLRTFYFTRWQKKLFSMYFQIKVFFYPTLCRETPVSLTAEAKFSSLDHKEDVYSCQSLILMTFICRCISLIN